MNNRDGLSLAQRMDMQRKAAHDARKNRDNLTRAELRRNAAHADVELARGTDELGAAVLKRDRADAEYLAAVRQARGRDSVTTFAGGYGRTATGRSERRAAIHAAKHVHAETTTEQRDALAKSLADGCTRMQWGRDRVQFELQRREAGLRTGRKAPTIPFGDVTLSVTQDGRTLVLDGVVIAERDSSRDETCDAIRKQATTTVAVPSRDGSVLQRAGLTGLDAHKLGQAIIAAGDAADREAAKRAAQVVVSGPMRPVPVQTRCVGCGQFHAAHENCADHAIAIGL